MPVKYTVEILENFVAFSEYVNFKLWQMKKQNLYFSYFMEITKIPFLFVLVDCNWEIKILQNPSNLKWRGYKLKNWLLSDFGYK